MSSDRVEALTQALEASPENHALRLVLADMLYEEGRPADALTHYEMLIDREELPENALVRVGRLALEQGSLQLAARCLERARALGVIEGVRSLQTDVERELGAGEKQRVLRGPDGTAIVNPDDLIEEALKITFEDVGGLDDVKKTIHRTIILPFQRPDLYLKYGRRVGGGVMLYGAPGCGKTLMARATAGECDLPFLNVRIEDVLDPFLGVAENNLHAAFEQARAKAPCVLFLDELDALAYARRKQGGSAARSLVDQLLQELDAIGSDNRDLLILSATNAPWDVDDGLKRPGRLDRLLFVPPPDRSARVRIVELLLADRHVADDVDVQALARRTPLFSGADLRSLVEQAVDAVIEEALDSGSEPPLAMRHLDNALDGMRPTTLDWLASARNYVEFANQAGRYDDVAGFLRSKEAKAWR